jgi:nitroreductase
MLTDQSRSVLSKLEWRYATQKFDSNKKIDEATWDIIEKALILTPSSWGLQTWKFVVVTKPELKTELVGASYGQKQVQDCSHVLVICRPNKLTEEYIDEYVEHTANLHKISCADLGREREMMLRMHKSMTDEQSAEWMANQCYIALGNLMTTASMLDIDTCPMEGFSKKDFDRILQLQDFECCSVVVCAMGYRSADDTKALLPKVRFPHHKVVVRI